MNSVMNPHLRNLTKRAVTRPPGTILRLRASYYTLSVIILVGLVWSFNGLKGLLSNSGYVFAASDPVIAAAGDIACDPTDINFNLGNGGTSGCHEKATSDLLVNKGFAAVLALGDNQYYCGGYQAFLQSYDPTWGLVKSITHPVVGNHEYLSSNGTDCDPTGDAAGYFQYYGAAAGTPGAGYYSYDIGTWHVIALNSNCSDAGGCSINSPQGKWLEADLAAHSNFCTLAYWHIPLFSSGGRAAANSQSFWNSLYNHNADLILSGHDHIYERFAPQSPSGVADPDRGIREFIVGTGGANHTSIPGNLAANSEVQNVNTYGILKLTLHPNSYDWQFVPEAGKTFTDSGSGVCHDGTTTTTTPSNTPTTTPSNTPTPTHIPTSTATLSSPPAAATLLSPTGNIGTNHGPTYTWNQVNGSTWYLLQVNGPNGMVVYQWYTSAQAGCNGSTCSITPSTTLGGGAYTWWVLTYDAAGDGMWSSGMNFSTTIPARLGPATQVSPTGSIGTNHSPTYKWNKVTGSTWYLLQVNGPSGTMVYQWYTSTQAGCNGSTCSIAPATALAGGSYTWWVLTYSSIDGTWSSGLDFTISP